MKILQYGCVGTRNYGDEVSAQIIRRTLRGIFPEAEFRIIGSGEMFLEKHHPDTQEFSTRNDVSRIEKFCKDTDLFVYGAGTIFTKNLLPNVDLISERVPGLKIAWGVGCEKFPEGSSAASFAAKADLIGVRDGSARHLDSFGAKVVAAPDPMFLEGNLSRIKTHNAICLSWGLTRGTEALQETVLKKLAGIVNSCEDKKWVALPAAWDAKRPSGNFDDDRLLHLKLSAMCDLEVVTPESFSHLSRLISETKTLVTSRLHVGVVGYASDVDVYWFGPEKNRVMAEHLGLGERYLGGYDRFNPIEMKGAPFRSDTRIRSLRYHIDALQGPLNTLLRKPFRSAKEE